MIWRMLVLVTGSWLVLTCSTMTAFADKSLITTSFDRLKHWRADDHLSALQAFALSCREIVDTGASFKRSTKYDGRRGRLASGMQAGNAHRENSQPELPRDNSSKTTSRC